jgi:hypothetical protein
MESHIHTWTNIRRKSDDNIVAMYVKNDIGFDSVVPEKYLTDDYYLQTVKIDAKLSDLHGNIIPPEVD